MLALRVSTPAVLAFTLAAPGCFEPSVVDEAGETGSSTTGGSADDVLDGHDATSGGPGGTSVGPGDTSVDGGTDPGGATDADDSDDAVCGNGLVETGEECDDGADNGDTAACLSNCQLNVCGDGFVHDGVEECDDGADNGDHGCTATCKIQFYSGSTATCSMGGLLMCGYFDAQCRVDPMGAGGGELCYWPDAVDETACDGTPGIWTSTDSGFARNARHMVFPEPGVCITQYTNLQCSNANHNTCLANGATLCFQEKASDGGASGLPSICWWNATEAQCSNTPGIWSTQENWGQVHPNTLPPGGAACITQVTNL
jgi:cysteine-rich repeat protein